MMQVTERILTAFLTCSKKVDIQREAGISERKYYSLIRDPEFKALLAERRDALVKEGLEQMRSQFSRNLERLQEIIDGEETSPQVRINALTLYFSQLGIWTERVDLLKRLEALEGENGI